MGDEPQGPQNALVVIEKRKYSEEDRETAYQLWAWQYGRNAATVAAVKNFPERTVEHWARHDGWAERASREARSLAPAVHEYTVAKIMMSAPKSIDYVYNVVDGTEKPDKVRLAAAVAALAMAGYTQDGPRHALPAPEIERRDEDGTLSPEQIIARELERLAAQRKKPTR